jgi:hypothetical protein
VASIQWQSKELLRPCRSNKILEGGRGVTREGTVGGERKARWEVRKAVYEWLAVVQRGGVTLFDMKSVIRVEKLGGQPTNGLSHHGVRFAVGSGCLLTVVAKYQCY